MNLSSPTLTQKVCTPLTLPHSQIDAEGWGSLTFDGKFAVSAGSSGVYLEGCGTHLHEFLTYTTNLADCPLQACAPPANSHMIIWQSAAGRLGGIFLPSRQRFSIPVPPNVERNKAGGFANGDGVTIALTSSTLYLLNQYGQIWTTPSPSAPSSR